MFEVLCAEWAIKYHKKGQLGQIIRTTPAGKIKPDSLRKFKKLSKNALLIMVLTTLQLEIYCGI